MSSFPVAAATLAQVEEEEICETHVVLWTDKIANRKDGSVGNLDSGW